ncbi:hypothetical protein QFZ82_005603 [Streptomyces sp. V4I23]|nr:hypothetical protein [Streptomyces sp. V4I23]
MPSSPSVGGVAHGLDAEGGDVVELADVEDHDPLRRGLQFRRAAGVGDGARELAGPGVRAHGCRLLRRVGEVLAALCDGLLAARVALASAVLALPGVAPAPFGAAGGKGQCGGESDGCGGAAAA